MVIAIDGPAGAGKSTVAKLLAKKLGIAYLDTGALYRAVTVGVLSKKIIPSDEDKDNAFVDKCSIDFSADGKILLDGLDVSEEIRKPYVNSGISDVAKNPYVRKVLGKIQRMIAQGKDVVVEGRDATTVVFPDAQHKIYLDASIKIRAQRRYKELSEKGIKTTLFEIESSIEKRDRADTSRADGPLRKAADARYLDTSGLTIDEVVEALVKITGRL